jgi:hypothetical protein
MNEDAIVEVLGDHQAAIDDLYARLEALDATGTHKKLPKWNWRSLSPSDLEAMWKRLWPWVEWLRTRYELSEAIPPCWYRHGAMVEELTALFAAWKAAYEDRRARAEAPLTWHEKLDHWRPPAGVESPRLLACRPRRRQAGAVLGRGARRVPAVGRGAA